jgi:hypothetical protein
MGRAQHGNSLGRGTRPVFFHAFSSFQEWKTLIDLPLSWLRIHLLPNNGFACTPDIHGAAAKSIEQIVSAQR